jgi:hypothetical protein
MGTTPLLRQMSRPPTVRLWVAPVNGNLATLPAEDGRRRRPPAGPALRRVEEVVTSRSHQRIDRPLLPELPPSGRQVSGTRGQAGHDGHAGVRGRRTPWTGVRLPTAGGHRHGHVVVPAAAAADVATVRPATGPEPLLPQATPHPGQAGMVGVRPAWPRPWPVWNERCPTIGTAGHFRGGRPACRPDSRHPRTRCRLRCHLAGAVATGTGPRGGGHWSDATSAGGREPAGRSAGRGAGRGHRSSAAG